MEGWTTLPASGCIREPGERPHLSSTHTKLPFFFVFFTTTYLQLVAAPANVGMRAVLMHRLAKGSTARPGRRFAHIYFTLGSFGLFRENFFKKNTQ